MKPEAVKVRDLVAKSIPTALLRDYQPTIIPNRRPDHIRSYFLEEGHWGGDTLLLSMMVGSRPLRCWLSLLHHRCFSLGPLDIATVARMKLGGSMEGWSRGFCCGRQPPKNKGLIQRPLLRETNGEFRNIPLMLKSATKWRSSTRCNNPGRAPRYPSILKRFS